VPPTSSASTTDGAAVASTVTTTASSAGTTTPAETTTAATTTAPTTPASTTPVTFAPLPEIAAGDPDLRTGTLPNGLTYYIRKNDRPGGSAELRLVVDAGSGRQQDGQDGVAHFLEHMMFNGTTSYPKNELVDVLRKAGAQFGADINAYTTYDETVYQLDVPTTSSSTLDTGIGVLSEWLSAATLDLDEVTKERGVVLDELRSRSENSDGRSEVVLESQFLQGSTYADRAPIGTAEAIQAMTTDTLRAFYDAWYRPDDAAVVVVGDINPDAVLTQIQTRFGHLQPRGDTTAAAPLAIAPSTTGVAGRIADPDLTTRSVELTLPLVAEQPTSESLVDAAADELGFTIIANRLSDDSTRGDTPFSDAYVSNNNLVRPLDAPSVVVKAKTGKTDDAMVALTDEFERVHRFGFDQAELQRAIDADRAHVEQAYEARDTRQDAAFADSYASTFLTGSPILTADAAHTLTTFILDHMTTDFVGARFEQRWAHTGPYVTVYGPQSEDAALPTLDRINATTGALAQRPVTERAATAAVSGDLMDPPAAVSETAKKRLASNKDLYLTPTELDFGNGTTVILNHSGISDNAVTLSAVSNGGLNALDPADQPDGRVAADVVTTSGAGAHEEAQLRQLLAGATVDVHPSIGVDTDTIDATSSTADVNVMLELVHLYMAAPNVDPVALQREIADATSTAADPFSDQARAAQATLARARYGDDHRYVRDLTTADIASLDADGIRRAWTASFGNATGWTFTISGDIDVDAVADLARQYLGTLPGTGSDVAAVEVNPAPPDGVVVKDIQAGTGNTATLLRLYSMEVPKTVANHVVADIATEVVSARILKRIREDTGQSYSPTAAFSVTPADGGGDDVVDLYFEMTVAPDQVATVATTLDAEITDLVTKGPSAAEAQAAGAVVAQRYNYLNDGQLCGYMVAEHTGIGDVAGDFVTAYTKVRNVSAAAVRTYLSTNLPLSRYIEVHALPR
jgi:zinc protease